MDEWIDVCMDGWMDASKGNWKYNLKTRDTHFQNWSYICAMRKWCHTIKQKDGSEVIRDKGYKLKSGCMNVWEVDAWMYGRWMYGRR